MAVLSWLACGYLHGFESRLALWPESESERMQLILPFFEKVKILFEAFKGDDDMLLLVRCGAQYRAESYLTGPFLRRNHGRYKGD